MLYRKWICLWQWFRDSVTHCRHKYLYPRIQRVPLSVPDCAVTWPKRYIFWCTKWDRFLSTQTVVGMDFLKLKNSKNSCLLTLCIYTLFLWEEFYENQILDFGQKKKKIKNKTKNKVRHAEHNSKVSRLSILKITRSKHQNRAWLSLILYCVQTSLLSLFYYHTLT